MKILSPLFITALALADTLLGGSNRGQTAAASPEPLGTRVQMIVTGGHETDPRDQGRPVVLIASALHVSPEIFREAFRQVTPAPAGEIPDPPHVQRNKQTLLRSLGPYGIRNDRLDEVSNFYRYNGRSGHLWRHNPAVIQATVHGGKVTGFTILYPGAGYTSAPVITIPGLPDVHIAATISFGTDLEVNGSIKSIAIL